MRCRQVFAISFLGCIIARRVNYYFVGSAVLFRDFGNIVVRCINPRMAMMANDVSAGSIIRVHYAVA